MPANSISRVTDRKKQQAETDRYWRGLSIGERFAAVWDVSAAACAFAAAFHGTRYHHPTSQLQACGEPGYRRWFCSILTTQRA